ncbi:MAG: HAD-IA family hydrolase [Alphaproteobacteria bacterium]|nr:HAD-IA family hydrolase [Alphaproteobacteria bacterium]
MDLSSFDALTFDCYGTLIDWESGIAAALRPWSERRGLGLDDGALVALFSRHESAVQEARPDALYPEILAGVLDRMAAEIGAEADAADRAAFSGSVADWPPFADSAAALAQLHKHYKLAVLSNIDRETFRPSNDRLGVAFDLIVTAQDVGSYKPALNHFHVGIAELAAMGIPQDRVLHVAQSLFHDHVPAKSLGLATVWINRQAGQDGATPPPPVDVTPDLEFPTLQAFADAVEATPE